MKRTTLWLSLVVPIVLLLIVTVRTQTPAPAVDLAGTYGCSGANPDGKTYSAVATITQHGAIWALHWDSGPPENWTTEGFGLVRDGVLAVIYQTSTGRIGFSAYTITETDGVLRLVGTWSEPGISVVGTETLTRTAAGQAPPARPTGVRVER